MSTTTPDPLGLRHNGVPCDVHDVCDGEPGCVLYLYSVDLPAGEWRVSVADDGTRTVTPLRRGVFEDRARLMTSLWADAPENGDPTDEG